MRALSPVAERRFSSYWRIIKPLGAFVSWQLLRAIRYRAQRSPTATDHERDTAGVDRRPSTWDCEELRMVVVNFPGWRPTSRATGRHRAISCIHREVHPLLIIARGWWLVVRILH
jgi:hypothetical protein